MARSPFLGGRAPRPVLPTTDHEKLRAEHEQLRANHTALEKKMLAAEQKIEELHKSLDEQKEATHTEAKAKVEAATKATMLEGWVSDLKKDVQELRTANLRMMQWS